MKRTNVVLDEKLLEQARRASGQRTYSAAINEALAEYVRKRDFWTAYYKFAEEARKGGMFHEGYLEEIRPNAYAVIDAKKKRHVSADVKRAPRKKSLRRGTR